MKNREEFFGSGAKTGSKNWYSRNRKAAPTPNQDVKDIIIPARDFLLKILNSQLSSTKSNPFAPLQSKCIIELRLEKTLNDINSFENLENIFNETVRFYEEENTGPQKLKGRKLSIF